MIQTKIWVKLQSTWQFEYAGNFLCLNDMWNEIKQCRHSVICKVRKKKI